MLQTRSLPQRLPVTMQGALFFLLCFALSAVLLLTTPGFPGTDDYYHARISAEIIAQRRLALDFIWLPYTILSPDRFVDHHLLYHLFLAPWVALGGMTGAEIAQALIVAGTFTAGWALLRSIGTRHAALWAFALFGLSVPFLHRLLMIRTQAAALLLLILGLHALFQRRHRWLLVIAFAYTWLYDGFILIVAFAALAVLAEWIADRRLDVRPVVYAITGVGLGLIINPYFPRNIVFIAEHLGAKVAFESGIRVGNEWYPYQTATLLENSGGALLALALGLLRPSFGGRRDRVETTLLLVALLTLAMLFRSRRFIEYYPAFALLFAAASWGRGDLSLRDWLPDLRVVRRLASGVALTSAALAIGLTVAAVHRSLDDVSDPATHAGAAAWLAEHSSPGSLVFQTDWDDFTRLFYHNTHNTYLVGLDPTYLERASRQLWDSWVAITRGQVEQPSATIHRDFGAAYVVSDTQHPEFAARAESDPGLRMVYRDAYSVVWEVLPAELAGNVQP